MNKLFAEFVNSINEFHGTVDANTDWLSGDAWTTPESMKAARQAQLAWEEYGPCQIAASYVIEAQMIEESTE